MFILHTDEMIRLTLHLITEVNINLLDSEQRRCSLSPLSNVFFQPLEDEEPFFHKTCVTFNQTFLRTRQLCRDVG